MSKNISFEEYREQVLSEQISKLMPDSKVQKELDDFYVFSSDNKYKLFLSSLFYNNHFRGIKSPLTGFLFGFDSLHLESILIAVKSELKKTGRDFHIVEAAGKSYIDCIKSITGNNYRSSHDAFLELKEVLLTTDKVIVIKEFSKSKSRNYKPLSIRSIIKVLHDAHFNDISPLSDLIFIDHAEFLQKAWNDIGAYIRIEM